MQSKSRVIGTTCCSRGTSFITIFSNWFCYKLLILNTKKYTKVKHLSNDSTKGTKMYAQFCSICFPVILICNMWGLIHFVGLNVVACSQTSLLTRKIYCSNQFFSSPKCLQLDSALQCLLKMPKSAVNQREKMTVLSLPVPLMSASPWMPCQQ